MNNIQATLQSISRIYKLENLSKEEVSTRIKELDREIMFLTQLQKELKQQTTKTGRQISTLKYENYLMTKKINFSDLFKKERLKFNVFSLLEMNALRWKTALAGTSFKETIRLNNELLKYLDNKLKESVDELSKSMSLSSEKSIIKDDLTYFIENTK